MSRQFIFSVHTRRFSTGRPAPELDRVLVSSPLVPMAALMLMSPLVVLPSGPVPVAVTYKCRPSSIDDRAAVWIQGCEP